MKKRSVKEQLTPLFIVIIAIICLTAGTTIQAGACTGITLKANDGSILFGRTMEWGAFDLNGRVIFIPRGHEFTGHTPDGKGGYKWEGRYAVVGTDMLERKVLADGLNEKGLALGLLYHPGYAVYAKYDPNKAGSSIGPTDVAQYLLTSCATVDEVRTALKRIRVVPVIEPALGVPAPAHFIVVDQMGGKIVIEFEKGEARIFNAPLGVMTNAPTYDWHTTNLRNYVNLSPVAIPDKKIEDMKFTPLGAGSGMIGLPGDFTPPSRFIRAVAFTATARKTANGPETMYEMFRILDNFNVPLGAAEGSEREKNTSSMRSSTIWTVVYDTFNKVMYYHTQHNRRVRKVNFGSIDFGTLKGRVITRPLDINKTQDFEVLNLPEER